MNGNWSAKWKKCLIWFCSYASIVAFALVGGYTIIKSDDEELKKTAKTSFIVLLIFAAIGAFFTIFSNFASMSDTYYQGAAYDFYSYSTKFLSIGEIVTYAVFIILELVKKDGADKIAAEEKNSESKTASEE